MRFGDFYSSTLHEESRTNPDAVRLMLRRKLYEMAGDVVATSRDLNVSRQSLQRILRRVGIDAKEVERYRLAGHRRFRATTRAIRTRFPSCSKNTTSPP